LEIAEKEVHDTSCLGSGVFPRLKKSTNLGGLAGCLRLFQQSLFILRLMGVILVYDNKRPPKKLPHLAELRKQVQ
jgi:hypothetical protein